MNDWNYKEWLEPDDDGIDIDTVTETGTLKDWDFVFENDKGLFNCTCDIEYEYEYDRIVNGKEEDYENFDEDLKITFLKVVNLEATECERQYEPGWTLNEISEDVQKFFGECSLEDIEEYTGVTLEDIK